MKKEFTVYIDFKNWMEKQLQERKIKDYKIEVEYENEKTYTRRNK